MTGSDRAMHTLAQELAHPPSLDVARMTTAIAYQLRRETDAAHEQAEALIDLSTEQGFALYGAIGGILSAGARTAFGARAEQIGQIRQDLVAVRETGSVVWEPYFLGLLADAYVPGRAGRGGACHPGRSPGGRAAYGTTLGGGGAVPSPGEPPPAAAGDTAGGGGSLVPAGPGLRPSLGGEIARAAGRDEPQ